MINQHKERRRVDKPGKMKEVGGLTEDGVEND